MIYLHNAQARVEEVLAAEELRHLDAVAKREEKTMLQRMGEVHAYQI